MKWEEPGVVDRERSFVSGQWQMDQSEDGFYVSHQSFLLSPCGIGRTERQAFEYMLSKIADYREKLSAVEAEIHQHLAELNAGKSSAEQE